MLEIKKAFDLGAALTRLVLKLNGTDATVGLERDRLATTFRTMLGRPVGIQLVTEKAMSTLRPWLESEYSRSSDQAYVDEAVAAATLALDQFEPGLDNLDAVVDVAAFRAELAASSHAIRATLSERSEAVFDGLLDKCLMLAVSWIPKTDGFLSEAAVRLLVDLHFLESQMQDRFQSIQSTLSGLTDMLTSTLDVGQPAGDPDTLLGFLGEERSARYLGEMGGSPAGAMHLYLWNTAFSAQILMSVELVHSTLQSAIDRQLRTWSQTRFGTPNWSVSSPPIVSELVGRDLAKARARVGRRLADDPTRAHSQIVDGLPLKTWRYLLPSKDDARRWVLWHEANRFAFPNLTVDPLRVTDAVALMSDERNRIVRSEPLLDMRRSRAVYDAVFDVLGYVDHRSQELFTSRQRVTGLLAARPNKLAYLRH